LIKWLIVLKVTRPIKEEALDEVDEEEEEVAIEVEIEKEDVEEAEEPLDPREEEVVRKTI